MVITPCCVLNNVCKVKGKVLEAAWKGWSEIGKIVDFEQSDTDTPLPEQLEALCSGGRSTDHVLTVCHSQPVCYFENKQGMAKW